MQVASCLAAGWVVVLTLLLVVGCGDESALDLDAEREVELGWQAYGGGDHASALVSFERAVAQAPTLADAQNGLGWSRLGQSQELVVNPHLIEQALDAFQEALRKDGEHADAWVGLAETLFLRRKTSRDFVQAIDALDNALESQQPASLYRHDYAGPAELLALKATCFYYLGDGESALRIAQEALQLNPGQSAALTLLALRS